MKVALAQINTTVGDIEGNAARIIKHIERARDGGAELVVFPELAVFGYPPKDLVLRRDLVQKNVAALQRIAAACQHITAVVGYVRPDPTGAGKGNFNAAAACRDGSIIADYAKMLLPTYDVFDESRYFNPGREARVFRLATDRADLRVGLSICEDLWNDRQFRGRRVYDVDPVQSAVTAGAQLLINISASPFRVGVAEEREALFGAQVRTFRLPLVYVNQVGGNDDLLFDGASLVFCCDGLLIGRARAFDEDLLFVDPTTRTHGRTEPYPHRLESVHRALVLGLRDYIGKCGFDRVVVGLSGGIDSALVAVLAVEAIGADRVEGIAMPSRFSSKHSVEDAEELARNLGCHLRVIPIETVHRGMEEAVSPVFAGRDAGPGIAEENIQARIRGNILMAVSNKTGSLLLTTGNKSELAVGYCTLYGDMCGGLAVLSDVPKTMVYKLTRRINERAGRPCIPLRTIEKPPSAELRENQLDQDTLPPYDLLDAILEQYVEREQAVEEIVAQGFDRATVERVAQMVDRSEYKRKQAPVGLKVTSRAFGTGRRMPIAAKHR
jgi:NAD+ synthetase